MLRLTGETVDPVTADKQDKVCADSHARLFDYGVDVKVLGCFLMLGFFTSVDLVITTQPSHPSIVVMSRRRGGIIVFMSRRLRRQPLPL